MNYSEITPYVQTMSELSDARNQITADLYSKHKVNKGLRDLNGKGVVTGLTEISTVIAKEVDDFGNEIPCAGRLYYRGINVRDLVNGFVEDKRYGFEETAYLLLFSQLPDAAQLKEFTEYLASARTLPESFTRDMILKAPGKDMMNILSRAVLALYAYDDNPDDISTANVLRQCLFLISVFPELAVYAYRGYRHYHLGKSLLIRNPKPNLSTAENILHMLRKDGKFTGTEARILDLALVIHAEHGGGNNSTFTTHVVTSSGTDTYSAISAALGSLKGPKHGGANIKVMRMFDDMRKHINVKDRKEVDAYLNALLEKQAFDQAGLIYGMGHAIYSISDPRADILHTCAKRLAEEKGFEEQYQLYEYVAETAPKLISEKRKMYKGVSANVDFYSGLIYQMLGLPYELFTPIFAIARIVGWSAHRIEEIQNVGKIIRPAYIGVKEEQPYIPLSDRD